jgi:hypothetical protein
MKRATLIFLIVTGALSSMATIAVAQGAAQSQWQQEKCRIYAESWEKALDFFGSEDVNYNFMAGNENFIAGGCTEQTNVCPGSAQELEIANALTVAVMNAGAASTFMPFRCVDEDQGGDQQ